MITSEAFCKLSNRLEEHHALFYTMWQMGCPVMDTSIETACVRFNKEGKLLEFAFNPNFWASSTDEDRLFTIAHECLHVILEHGKRTRDTKTARRCNIAVDLVVNHSLVNMFGFSRKNLTYGECFCWVDKIFPDKEVPDDLSFEDYFNRLPDEYEGNNGSGMVDDHSTWAGEDVEEILKKINDKLPEENKQRIQDFIEKHSPPGDEGGTACIFVNVKAKPKKKWETVIKKWMKRHNQTSYKEHDQWARLNRRYSLCNADLILPSEMEIEEEVNGKIQVWFFQDTSGSCYGFHKRFFEAAKSLPTNRFDVKMHCFDTKVYETTLESGKLYGFGGTTYQPIEDYIQSQINKTGCKYPEAIFIITDGYGNRVTPKHPKRWHWFLSTGYTEYIPQGSRHYMLSQYE